MMNTLLIVITYLAGSAMGPVVHTNLMPSPAACQIAARAVLANIDSMSKTNAVAHGQTNQGLAHNGRQVATAECKDLTKSPAVLEK